MKHKKNELRVKTTACGLALAALIGYGPGAHAGALKTPPSNSPFSVSAVLYSTVAKWGVARPTTQKQIQYGYIYAMPDIKNPTILCVQKADSVTWESVYECQLRQPAISGLAASELVGQLLERFGTASWDADESQYSATETRLVLRDQQSTLTCQYKLAQSNIVDGVCKWKLN